MLLSVETASLLTVAPVLIYGALSKIRSFWPGSKDKSQSPPAYLFRRYVPQLKIVTHFLHSVELGICNRYFAIRDTETLHWKGRIYSWRRLLTNCYCSLLSEVYDRAEPSSNQRYNDARCAWLDKVSGKYALDVARVLDILHDETSTQNKDDGLFRAACILGVPTLLREYAPKTNHRELSLMPFLDWAMREADIHSSGEKDPAFTDVRILFHIPIPAKSYNEVPSVDAFRSLLSRSDVKTFSDQVLAQRRALCARIGHFGETKATESTLLPLIPDTYLHLNTDTKKHTYIVLAENEQVWAKARTHVRTVLTDTVLWQSANEFAAVHSPSGQIFHLKWCPSYSISRYLASRRWDSDAVIISGEGKVFYTLRGLVASASKSNIARPIDAHDSQPFTADETWDVYAPGIETSRIRTEIEPYEVRFAIDTVTQDRLFNYLYTW